MIFGLHSAIDKFSRHIPISLQFVWTTNVFVRVENKHTITLSTICVYGLPKCDAILCAILSLFSNYILKISAA